VDGDVLTDGDSELKIVIGPPATTRN